MAVRQCANWENLSSIKNYLPKLFTFLKHYDIISINSIVSQLKLEGDSCEL